MEYFTVGLLVNTQGVRGEVRVVSRTDFPEKRFAKGSTLIWFDATGEKKIPLTVKSSRKHKQFYLLSFEGHDSIDDVERYKGGELKIPANELASLEGDSNYIHDIVGCRVIDEDGHELGVCIDVLQPGANDVYVVRSSAGKDILLPAIKSCILEVDVANNIMKVHILPGLLD